MMKKRRIRSSCVDIVDINCAMLDAETAHCESTSRFNKDTHDGQNSIVDVDQTALNAFSQLTVQKHHMSTGVHKK